MILLVCLLVGYWCQKRDTNMPLTDVKCRNAKGQISPYKLSDGGGLYLLVNSEGAKYWRLAYRWHGKQRTLALGVYPKPTFLAQHSTTQQLKVALVRR